MGRLTVKEENTQGTPPTGYNALYPKEDSKWYFKDDAGTETELLSGAHKASHQNGGTDEISVAGLSGALADEQDAGKIKGADVTITDLRKGQKLYYDAVTSDWVNEASPVLPYTYLRTKDWSPSWADLEDSNVFMGVNTQPAVLSHVGNGTVSYLNGISATTGDTYTVTDTGLLTAGSLGVSAGFIVVWMGAAWAYAAPPDAETGIYVSAGLMVQLSSTTALIAPYTDGTDDGKLIGFDGTDNTGFVASQDVTITLPDPATVPADSMLRGPFYIGKMAEGGTVTVGVAGSGTFFDDLPSALLDHKQDVVQVGVVNSNLAASWMRISALSDYLQLRRAATWAATNFSTAAGLPWDTEDVAGNPEINDWGSPTNPSRINITYSRHYNIGGTINIDTTGGSTWVFEAWLRKNGTTEIPGSRVRTGNYQGEDMAISLFGIEVELVDGDYIEWVCQHTNLTGNVHSATLTVSTLY